MPTSLFWPLCYLAGPQVVWDYGTPLYMYYKINNYQSIIMNFFFNFEVLEVYCVCFLRGRLGSE